MERLRRGRNALSGGRLQGAGAFLTGRNYGYGLLSILGLDISGAQACHGPKSVLPKDDHPGKRLLSARSLAGFVRKYRRGVLRIRRLRSGVDGLPIGYGEQTDHGVVGANA